MRVEPSPAAAMSVASPLPPASDVARGVCRMLLRHECVAIGEVPLDGGRRADLMGLDARGNIVIVEIKVSRADLIGTPFPSLIELTVDGRSLAPVLVRV